MSLPTKHLVSTRWQLPEHNPHFICIEPESFINISRKKLLETIKNQLDQKCSNTLLNCVTLSGLGGIGKTQLATEYAHQQINQYSFIAWIHANNNISQEFSTLLNALWNKKPLDFRHINAIDHFYQKLNTFQSYLLIFDDAEDYHSLSPYLPKQTSAKQHILITSRSQHWGRIIPINTFTPQESIYFISQQLPNESQQYSIKLAEQLGHLPLALSHAIAYIKSTAIDIHSYLLAYAETPKDILSTTLLLDLCETPYAISVYKTCSLSLENIKKKYAQAIDLLRYSAYLQPDKITRVLLKNIMGSEHTLNQSIAILRNYSLIDITEEKLFFNIHCLTQTTMRFILKEENREIKTISVWLQMLHERYEYDREKPAIFKEYLAFSDHVTCILKYAEEYITQHRSLLDLYIKVMASLAMYHIFEKHEYTSSQKNLFKLLELSRHHKLPTNPTLFAKIYNAIGFACFKEENDKPNKGAEFFEETLKLYKQKYNTHTAFALHGLGCIYYEKKMYDNAIDYLKKAVGIIQKIYGENHIDLARCMSSLGECYYATAQFKLATSTCLKAIEVGQSISTDGYNFDVADAYYTLSMVLQAENNNKPTQNSLEYFQKSLDIFKKLLNQPTHKDIIKIETQITRAQSLLNESTTQSTFTMTTLGDVKIKLSHREMQSLFFLVKGMSAKQTAYTLHLSQRTVETYLGQIKKKLKCRTKLQLLSLLSKEDIASLEQYLLPPP